MTDEGGAVPPQQSVPPVATPAPEVVVSEVSIPVTESPIIVPPVVPDVPAPAVSPETVKDISEGITEKVADAVQEMILGVPPPVPAAEPAPAAGSAATPTAATTSMPAPAPEALVPIASRRGDALAKRRAMKAECLEEVMHFAARHPTFANDDLEEHLRRVGFPIADSTMRKYLHELVILQRLKRAGKGKGSRYSL